jgi:hypothetical protein
LSGKLTLIFGGNSADAWKSLDFPFGLGRWRVRFSLFFLDGGMSVLWPSKTKQDEGMRAILTSPPVPLLSSIQPFQAMLCNVLAS